LETLNLLVKWLSDNESALSATAAIGVIAGILYGALRYVLTPLLRRTTNIRRTTNNNQKRADLEPLKDIVPDNKPIRNAPMPSNDRNFSIAIMLFDSLSSNPDDEFIAAGITSEIIVHVTTVPTIRVSSRLSSYRAHSSGKSFKEMAEQLNAKFVLSGNLQRAGDRIQVTAELTDIDSETEIWARTYKRDIEDVFEVQHDIARCIVGTVLGEVKFAQTAFAEEIPYHQLDSWGLVQKAYHFWLTAFSQKGVEEASSYLRQAIKISPNYARAHAALAMLRAQQLIAGTSGDYGQCLKEARRHIEKAYQLAPSDIEVLENAGVAWLHLGEGRRATLALRSAIKIAPLNLIARGYLALVLAVTGGKNGAHEAIDILEQNFSTAPKHPSSPYWNYFRALADQRLGNQQQAIEYAELSLAEQPGWMHSHLVIANAFCVLGDIESAQKSLNSVKQVNPFLTADLYHTELTLETSSADDVEAFCGGLVEHGFINLSEKVEP
jgi:adenylate cyclase